jgi:Meckel syndrome type 1 protein
MNTHLPDDERLPGEDELAALYRKLPPKEPGPALDAAVLRAAAQAVQAPRRRPRWPVALGSAAVLVVAAGLGWRMRDMPPKTATPPPGAVTMPPESPTPAPSPPPAAAAAAPAAAQAQPAEQKPQALPPIVEHQESPPVMLRQLPETTRDIAPAQAMRLAPRRPAPKATADHLAATPEAAPAFAPEPPPAPPAPPAPALPSMQYAPPPAPAAPPMPPAAMPARRIVPPAAPAPMPMPAAPAVGEQNAPAAAANEVEAAKVAAPPASMMAAPKVAAPMGEMSSDLAPRASDTPEQELGKIRGLLALQRRDEARQRLADFHRDHPDYRLPDDLRPWLPTP